MLAWLGILIMLFFYAAIPALASQLATNYLLQFKPRFQHLFLLILGSLFTSFLIGLLISSIFSSSSQFKQKDVFTPIVTFLIIKFLVFSKYIKHPETGSVGGKSALKIIAISLVPEIVVWLILALILMVLFNMGLFNSK